MDSRWRFVWLLLEFSLHWVCSQSNSAGCLDFRSPFRPSTSLSFCTDYSSLGCCGAYEDDQLEKDYDYIRSKTTELDWNRCQDYVKAILCTKCSSFATVLYREGTNKFPGMCNNYCQTFYDSCSHFLWFLEPTLAISNLATTKERFCTMVESWVSDISYCYPDVTANHIPALEDSFDAKAVSPPSCVCLEMVKDRLANPLFARPARDGSGRVFVAEQYGQVWIYRPRQNSWNSRPFLDMRSRVKAGIYPGDEKGFYGLAFHPEYKTNGRFFVSYYKRRNRLQPLPDELKELPYPFDGQLQISEMKPSNWNQDRGDKLSEKTIFEYAQFDDSHNSGEIFFGEDGYLYVLLGDGGLRGDPILAGQNKSLLYGKVLRLDVDSDPNQPYTVPDDNPFVGEDGAKPEIYAYGLRNPWRCGVDTGDKETGEFRGRVLCGDVGQGSYEEIDELKKGGNYGWNSREGFECYNEDTCGAIGEEELPIAVYNHTIGLCVTGGVFYRGCQSPNLDGIFIYGDYAKGRLWTLKSTNGKWMNSDLDLCDQSACQGGLFSSLSEFILSFGEDEDGEAYVLTSDSSRSLRRNGHMYKVVDPSWRNDPSLCPSDTQGSQRILSGISRNQIWVLAYNILRVFKDLPMGQTLVKDLLDKNGIAPNII